MTVQVAARVEPSIKEKASQITAEFGLDLSTAIKMFVTRIAKERRIPLEISKPVVSLNGDEFETDQKYFEQIPGFLDMIDKELKSKERYTLKEAGWNV